MKEMSVVNAKIPTHLQARIGQQSSLTAALATGGGESVPRISIRGSRFRLVEDGTETVLDSVVLETVIVGANPRLSKAFYAKAYDGEVEAVAPDCFSLDGIQPDASIASPVNDICATCPNNAWGSKIGPSGQELKACSDKKRLAIVSADDPEGTIYLLEVTPSALKGLNQYQKQLALRGIPAEVVKTVISFDTDASYPKIQFSFGGFLDEETQEAVDKLFDTDEVKLVTGEMVAQAPAAPATKASKPTLVRAEPEPEPETPKRGFGKKAPPKTEAKSKSVAKPKPEPEPEDDLEVDVDDLAAEIEKLLGGEDDD